MNTDIVITWVDGSDPEWLSEKRKYRSEDPVGNGRERYHEWGLLKYWFRCIEKNASWVRKIHFVTWGNVPEWLDVSNPRLHIIKHEDFMPKSAIPCFNSALIERYLHKIPGLSEQFIYFNDDMYLLGKCGEDFFFRNGLPRDMLAFQPVVANPSNPVMSHHLMNDSLVLSKHFDKRTNVRKQPGAYFHPGYPPLYFFYNLLELAFPKFTGLYTVHSASPMLKSVFDEVWSREGEYLGSLDKNRFRDDTDVNQYLFREWGKLSGRFVPSNVTGHFKYYELSDDLRNIPEIISSGGKRALLPDIKVLCLNDTGLVHDEAKVAGELIRAFDQGFGEKCSFEK